MLIPAACAWIGAAAAISAVTSAPAVCAVAFGLAILGVVSASITSSRKPAPSAATGMVLLVSCCAASVGLVAASVVARDAGRHPSELRALADSQLEVVLEVTSDGVVTRAASASSTVRFSADIVTATRTDGRRLQGLDVPVMVFAPVSDDELPRIGERWLATGALRWTEPADARSALVFARTPATRVTATPDTLAWSIGLRSGLVTIAEGLPGPGAELIPGLAIGDVSLLSDHVGESMQRSSLSHLTAVSGANCAIIVWLITSGAARLGAGRLLRIVLALTALVAFVVLVTPQPSVQRAALMAAVVLCMGGIGRPMRGLAALSLAVIILLVADPWLAGQFGFGLSVLATAGLLLLSRPLTEVLARWVPRGLATLIAVPTAAQLACQPMLVLLDPAIQLGGIPANLLAGPAAAPATLIGLVACLLAAVSMPLATGAAWLAWVPATWIGAVASWFAGLSGTRLPWPEGGLGVLLLALPTGAAVVLLLFSRRLPDVVVRAIGVGLLVAAVVVAGGSLGVGLGTSLQRPGDWIVAACDVGQGDAVLIRSGGAVALVDVGPDPEPLRACLDDLGIGRIDLLVLTHYDVDHVAGLAAVMGKVDEVLLGPVDDPADEGIARSLRDAGAHVRSAAAGDEGALGTAEGVGRWRVLWPDPAVAGITPGNDASVVVRFDLPDAAVLLLGDLGEDAQDRLLAGHGIGGAVDIVKVSHHGSADQSARLARRLDPSIAMVSVGADNGYGHPTRSAMQLYEGTGATPVRTDRSGAIVIAPSDAGGFLVWTERSDPPDRSAVGARR